MSKDQENLEQAAVDFVADELEQTKKALKNTQIWGSVIVGCLTIWMGSIAGGFAKNLEPSEAAKIAKGLAVQRISDAQPQISDYLKTEIPRYIEQVPEYALEQIPIYRASLEDELESRFQTFATETSSSLDNALDEFLIENEDKFKTIILAGQDKATTDEVAVAMREMFVAYLSEPSDDGESIQYKLDESLKSLREIEHRTWRMATQSNLTDSEMKTRRAVAVLFHTIDTNKDAWNLPTQGEVQDAVRGFIPDEALAPAEAPETSPTVATTKQSRPQSGDRFVRPTTKPTGERNFGRAAAPASPKANPRPVAAQTEVQPRENPGRTPRIRQTSTRE
ncbi:MAG: hypothetical protein MUC92_01945 [Fimbriimonadaceae bacterium]|jgi:hypothetical protein|nr:hypothetical protein [Fimbriimonadaceae bacterium]